MTTWTKEQQVEHRKLWVKALRSGKYQQARGVLRGATGAMCCLGVACEISGLGHWSDSRYLTETDEEGQVLPVEVRKWLGLKALNGTCLAQENDKGASFVVIADIIESEPEGLIA